MTNHQVIELWRVISGLVILAVVAVATIWKLHKNYYSSTVRKPESVNYHFTRQCNYECGFCFHTAKTSFVLPLEEVKRGMRMLKDAGTAICMLRPYSFTSATGGFTLCSV
jgi:hypothetical protein